MCSTMKDTPDVTHSPMTNEHPYDFWNLEYLKYPSPEWFRFRLLCKNKLCEMMIKKESQDDEEEVDMDFTTMFKLVMECNTPESVWKLVTEYNETYFREMIQTLEDQARYSFVNFTDLLGLQLPGPWTRSRTTDLSKAF